MIVFDLSCGHGHVFEAWFGSSAAFEAQVARAQVRCPVCDDTAVTKAVMAPNVAAKGNRAPAPRTARGDAIAALAAAQAAVLKTSQWVGTGFADRARAMHLGEEAPATIHGQASLSEAKSLVEDGVAVLPLPFPVVPPKAVN